MLSEECKKSAPQSDLPAQVINNLVREETVERMISIVVCLLPDRPAAGYRHCMDDGGQRGRVSGGFDRSTGRRDPLVHDQTVVPINRDGKRPGRWRRRSGIHNARPKRGESSCVPELNRINVIADHVPRIRVVRLNPVLPVVGGRRVRIFGDDADSWCAWRECRVERFLRAIDASDSCAGDRRTFLAVTNECCAAPRSVGL